MKEGFDLETDKLFCIWSDLKKLSISESGDVPQEKSNKQSASPEIPQPNPLNVQKQAVSPILDEILRYPHPAPVNKGK